MEHFNKFEFITADDMEKMFKTAAQYLLTYENQLNELNVFPVADRDTGSNLAQLMKRIISTQYPTSSIDNFLKALADDALLGACGNSGMIFAAFFAGFSDNNENDLPQMTIGPFLHRLKKGVNKAYTAVSEPVEGTILTAMSAWLKACESLLPTAKNFVFLFEKSLPVLEQAVTNTQQQLKVLKHHYVIDSGALAFYRFVEGMFSYLANPSCTVFPESIKTNDKIDDFHTALSTAPNYDYCTEMLLSHLKIDTSTLENRLKSAGGSIVINQSPHYTKIHLHTNDPLTITNYIKQHALIENQKVEGMRSQWQVIQQAKYRIALVVDSSADIDPAILQNEQIHVLPLNMRVGKQHLLDRLTIDLTGLYKELHQEQLAAQSAAVTPEVAQRTLSFLANYYESIIVITVSSQLSATHQLLSQIATRFPEGKITVIDSKRNSAAHGLLAMLVARNIKNGLDHQTICEKTKEAIANTQIWVAVDEFKTMVRSGRAPKLIGLLAGWSHIKPIVSLDKSGKPSLAGIGLGLKHAWSKIAKKIQHVQTQKAISQLAIVHTDCVERANSFARYIQNKTGIQPAFIAPTSTVIGLHAGQGCVGVAIMSEGPVYD